jgi:hypothetical protein
MSDPISAATAITAAVTAAVTATAITVARPVPVFVARLAFGQSAQNRAAKKLNIFRTFFDLLYQCRLARIVARRGRGKLRPPPFVPIAQTKEHRPHKAKPNDVNDYASHATPIFCP